MKSFGEVANEIMDVSEQFGAKGTVIILVQENGVHGVATRIPEQMSITVAGALNLAVDKVKAEILSAVARQSLPASALVDKPTLVIPGSSEIPS